MSCKTDVLNNGTLNNPTANGGKFNDSTINAPSITGGITLDKVTSDELVTAIESDLKKVIKELVESETFKQLTADKGIFNQGLDVTGSIVLDKVAIQSLAEQLLEATTKVATDEFAKAIKKAQAYIMSKGTINGATTIDDAAATSIHAAVQDKVKQDAETVAKQAIEDKLKEDLSLVLKGTELKNGLSMDDATKDAIFTRLSKDIQLLIDKSFKEDDSDVALMIANAIKAKFETDLGAIKATGAEFTRAKLVNPTIEGALSLDDAARKTIADVVTTTVVGTLDTLVQEKFDTTISCWVNENFGGKLAFAFSVIREEVTEEEGGETLDPETNPTPPGVEPPEPVEPVKIVKQVMDLVFFDITKDMPTKDQHKNGTLPSYASVVTIDLSSDVYSKSEVDYMFDKLNQSLSDIIFAVSSQKAQIYNLEQTTVEHQSSITSLEASIKKMTDLKGKYGFAFAHSWTDGPTTVGGTKVTKDYVDFVFYDLTTAAPSNSSYNPSKNTIANTVVVRIAQEEKVDGKSANSRISELTETVSKLEKSLTEIQVSTAADINQIRDCTGCWPDLEDLITYRTEDGKVGTFSIRDGEKSVYGVIKEVLSWGKSDIMIENTYAFTGIMLNLGVSGHGATVEKVPAYAPAWTNTLYQMFYGNKVMNDPNVSLWGVSHIIDMEEMFSESIYDHPLDSWDVSNVTNFKKMFWDSAYSHPLGSWDVSKAVYVVGSAEEPGLYRMFFRSKYNQDLSTWCVPTYPSDFTTDKDTNNFYGQVFPAVWTEPKPIWGTCPEASADVDDYDEGKEGFITYRRADGTIEETPIVHGNNLNIYTNKYADVVEIISWGYLKPEDIKPDIDYSIQLGPGITKVPKRIPSYITSMYLMFNRCTELNDENLVGWDTSKITNMTGCFPYMSAKINRDLSQWCTTNVKEHDNFADTLKQAYHPVWGTCPRGEDQK